MKKMKRDRSMTTKVKQVKGNLDCKASVPSSKKHLHHKKQTQCHKQNRDNKSMVHQVGIVPKITKKHPLKSKQRSKSLLCDRSNIEPPTQSSNRYALLELLQKKTEKVETDISAHLNSIRYDRQLFEFQKMYSNFLSPQRHNKQPLPQVYSQARNHEQITPKLKLLQQQNQTLRTNLSAVKQQINIYIKQNQYVKQQNMDLKHKITEFRFEANAQIQQFKAKQTNLKQNHKKQKESMQSKVKQLQIQQDKLLQDKKTLQTLVKNQQCNITYLEKEKNQLEIRYKQEVKEKKIIKKEKEQAYIRIQTLQQELQLFQSNLKEFQHIKETYQSRLVQLQKQKQKIKKNAFQLLEMVQSCREM